MRSSLHHRVLSVTFAAVVLLVTHVEAASKPTPFLTVSVRGPLVILNQEQLYCESSYALSECREQIQKLKQALQPYPTALLPNWKWVLVRAEHWKSVAASLH